MYNAQHKILRFLSFMMIFTTYLPIVYVNLPRYISGHNLWAPVWLAAVLLFSPKILKDKSIKFLLLFYGIVILLLFDTLWVDLISWNKTMVRVEFYQLSIAFSMIVYFISARDYKWLGTIAKISIIFIGVTAIVSIYASVIDPMYARRISHASAEDVQAIRRLGGGGYGFSNLLLCLFPIMVYYYKNKKLIGISKWLILFFGFICFIAVLRIQIFANVLLASLMILLSIAGRDSFIKSAIPSFLLIVVFISIPDSYYSGVFLKLSYYFDTDTEIHRKLYDLSGYLESAQYFEGTEGIAGRASRYPVMLSLFLSNPLFGYSVTGESVVTYGGEHLYWISRLAAFGLMGFIPFVLLFVIHNKRVYKLFGQHYQFYFLISLLSLVALGFMKVLAGREMWFGIFFVVPSLYYLPLAFKRGRPDLAK